MNEYLNRHLIKTQELLTILTIQVSVTVKYFFNGLLNEIGSCQMPVEYLSMIHYLRKFGIDHRLIFANP
jgi:hypothetical protein